MIQSAIQPVVLAAGQSSRFGENKLLADFCCAGVTAPLLAHSLQPWLQKFERVLVVVPVIYQPLQKALQAALDDDYHRLDWLPSAQSEAGMGHSLADAVSATAEAEGWLIGLADMPLLPTEAIAGVAELLKQGAVLAAARCMQRQGHPVGFSSQFYSALSTLQGDSGGRHILRQHHTAIQFFDCQHTGVLTDVDTPQALQALQVSAEISTSG